MSGLWPQFRIARENHGSAGVEFAITLPILAMLLIGIFDYANAMNIGTKLFHAARAGVQYGLKFPGDLTGVQNVANAATQQTTEGNTAYSVAAGTATSTHYCYNPTSTTTVINFATANPSSCPTGSYMGLFIALQPSTNPGQYSPMFSYRGIGSGSLTLGGSATVQVQ